MRPAIFKIIAVLGLLMPNWVNGQTLVFTKIENPTVSVKVKEGHFIRYTGSQAKRMNYGKYKGLVNDSTLLIGKNKVGISEFVYYSRIIAPLDYSIYGATYTSGSMGAVLAMVPWIFNGFDGPESEVGTGRLIYLSGIVVVISAATITPGFLFWRYKNKPKSAEDWKMEIVR